MSVYSDFSAITLRKMRHLQFLTLILRCKGVKLIFEIQGESVVIRTVKEAGQVWEELG